MGGSLAQEQQNITKKCLKNSDPNFGDPDKTARGNGDSNETDVTLCKWSSIVIQKEDFTKIQYNYKDQSGRLNKDLKLISIRGGDVLWRIFSTVDGLNLKWIGN